jgi:hypothetical protein
MLNINDLSNSTFDENELILRIFAGMITESSKIMETDPVRGQNLLQTSSTILTNYKSNPSNWIILGLPGQWPDEGLIDVFETQMLYVGTDAIFSGILNLNVELININQANNLNNIITERTLKFEGDPTKEELLDELYLVNSEAHDGELDWDLNVSKVQIFDVTYNGFYLIPAANSDYTGAAYISISSTVINKFINAMSSGVTYIDKLRVDAYNSTQEKTGDITKTFTPKLGRDAFIATYSTVSYGVSGSTWDNAKGTNSFENVSTISNIGQTQFTVAPINISSLKSGDIGVFSRIYDNVNAMKTNFTVSYNWSNDIFTIDFRLHVFAYATAWNAEWARTETSVSVVNFNLSK